MKQCLNISPSIFFVYKTLTYHSFLIFSSSICLDVSHLTNEHRTHHIASLEAHTTLNTYNLWNLALRSQFNTDARTRDRTRNLLITRKGPGKRVQHVGPTSSNILYDLFHVGWCWTRFRLHPTCWTKEVDNFTKNRTFWRSIILINIRSLTKMYEKI